MEKGEDLRKRLYNFALRVIKLVRSLPNELATREIGKQLIRSATSMAANYEEASASFSKREFTHKISIVLKESLELMNISGKSVKTARSRP